MAALWRFIAWAMVWATLAALIAFAIAKVGPSF